MDVPCACPCIFQQLYLCASTLNRWLLCFSITATIRWRRKRLLLNHIQFHRRSSTVNSVNSGCTCFHPVFMPGVSWSFKRLQVTSSTVAVAIVAATSPRTKAPAPTAQRLRHLAGLVVSTAPMRMCTSSHLKFETTDAWWPICRLQLNQKGTRNGSLRGRIKWRYEDMQVSQTLTAKRLLHRQVQSKETTNRKSAGFCVPKWLQFKASSHATCSVHILT